MSKVTIGTISHGTLRTEDLLETFADELNRLSDNPSHKQLIFFAQEWIAKDLSTPDLEQAMPWFAEDGAQMVGELSDALNEYAPVYCYFGTLEGDGSDFGFWLDPDALDEAIENSEPGDEFGEYVNEDDGVRINVSDHGNVEVYSIESGESLLAIV